MVSGSALVVERRIRAFDVSFGKPFLAADYIDLLMATSPEILWTCREGDNVNYGVCKILQPWVPAGHEGNPYPDTGEVAPSSVVSDSYVYDARYGYFGTPFSFPFFVMSDAAGAFPAILSAAFMPAAQTGLREVILCVQPDPNMYSSVGYAAPMVAVCRSTTGTLEVIIGNHRTGATTVVVTDKPLISGKFYSVLVSSSLSPESPNFQVYLNGEIAYESGTFVQPVGVPIADQLPVEIPAAVAAHITVGGFVDMGDGDKGGNASFANFNGTVEAVAFWSSRTPFIGPLAMELYKCGSLGIYVDPTDPQKDTAPLNVVSIDESYEERMAALGAVHYYRLNGSGNSGDLEQDTGASALGAVPLTYLRSTTSLPPALADETEGTASAKIIKSAGPTLRNLPGTAPLNCGVLAGSRTAMSVSFWFCLQATNSNDLDGMLSIATPGDMYMNPPQVATGNFGGILFAKQGSNIYAWKGDRVHPSSLPTIFAGLVFNTSSLSGNINTAGVKNSWHLMTVTVSATGVMRCFVDGVQQMVSPYLELNTNLVLNVPTNGQGVYIPANSRINIGGEPDLNDSPDFGLAHVAIFNRELSSSEIANMYSTGRSGAAYARLTSSGTRLSLLGYTAKQDRLPSLTNERDITHLVTEYSVEYGLNQSVAVASLTAADDMAQSRLETELPTNTYVIIEERYASLDYSDKDDTWQSVGHFLVDGPMRTSIDSTGKSIFAIALRSPLKLASFGTLRETLDADRITHKKALMSFMGTNGTAYEFQVNRPIGESDVTYKNWLNQPLPRIYTSAFQNRNRPNNADGSSAGTYGAEDLPSVIRIKDSQGSVQVVGGTGTLRVDSNFYDGPIPDGLGSPAKNGGIKATFDRYLAPNDVVTTTIASIESKPDRGVNGLVFTNAPASMPGRLYVKTGAAKGRLYKLDLTGYGGDVGYASNTKFSSAESRVPQGTAGRIAWVNPANALQPGAVSLIQYASCTMPNTVPAETSQYLLFPTLELPEPLDAGDIIKGVSIKLYASSTQGKSTVSAVGLYNKTTNMLTGVNQADYEDPTPEGRVYGGQSDTWGVTLTPANLNNYAWAIEVARTKASGPDEVRVYKVDISLHVQNADGQDVVIIRSMSGLYVNPVYEGINIGDEVEIGFANRPEDVLRYFMLYGGLQLSDATRPFYCNIKPLPAEYGGMTLPPQGFNADEPVTPLEALTKVMPIFPPNYFILPKTTGVVECGLVVQTNIPAFTVDKYTESSKDGTDVGVYTRVVARGQSTTYVNIADSALCAVRAYKLDNWIDRNNEGSATGVTYTSDNISVPNLQLVQLLDSNSRTPSPGSAGGWRAEAYGVMWQVAGRSVTNFSMEDEDLFAIDLGKNVQSGLEYLVESIEITHLQTFQQSAGIAQTISIYAMTEADYIAAYGVAPPLYPNQNLANLPGEVNEYPSAYMPKANSRAWKLLVDEFKLEAGLTQVSSGDFINQRPERFRFFKVEVNQAHTITAYGDDNRARINFTGIRVIPSLDIYATVSLGASSEFQSDSARQLLNQLRERIYVLENNPYLSDYAGLYAFGVTQLKEMTRDYSPKAVTLVNPYLRIGDTVKFVQKYSGKEELALVTSYRYSSGGFSTVSLVNYQ